MKLKIFIFIFSASIIVFPSLISAGTDKSGTITFETLNTLEPASSEIKLLRKDIRCAIVIIKRGGDPSMLPELKFYKYKVKGSDNFWKILSKTSLNIDTLSTVNSLSSAGDVTPGKDIFLSNIRGIIHKTDDNESLEDISKKYNIGKDYISRVNKITDNNIKKDFLFIPSGEVSNIERSLFLGTGFASPLKNSRRTSNFGKRIDPFNKKLEFHPGLDLACRTGSNVYASRKGKVIFTGVSGGYGLLVIIKHELGYSTYYGHLKKTIVKEGDYIERGNLIAISGNSGRSTGPHLHFEVRKETRPINPGVLL